MSRLKVSVPGGRGMKTAVADFCDVERIVTPTTTADAIPTIAKVIGQIWFFRGDLV
jgi:hypothetical protein